MKRFVMIFVLVASTVVAQEVPDDAVLATVAGETITAGEFRGRYALTVFPLKDQQHLTPVIKQQFLYSLIAERLLALEARRLGYAAEDRFARNRRMAEEMFVRDKLFRDQIRSKVSVSREEVYDRFVQEQSEIEYDFLFSESEEEIRNLHRICAAGMPFDSLLAEQKRKGLKDASQDERMEGAADGQGAETAGVRSTAEDLIRHVENLSTGAISAPVQGEGGWYLLRKIDHSRKIHSEYEFDQQYKRLENTLRSEKEAEATRTLVTGLWEDRSAQIEREPYGTLGDRLLNEYRRQAREGLDMLQAPADVFESLRRMWSMNLDSAFARIGDRVLTIGDALDRLQTFDLRLHAEELPRFPDLYRGRVRDMLDRFLITQHGYEQRLDQSDDVRQSVAMWAANGLAETVPEVLWEQYIANDDSLWAFYTGRPDLFGPPVEVRIIEVLHANPEIMVQVREAFDTGAKLEGLAVRYSQREGAAETLGKSEWFAVNRRGVIGRTAFGLRIADAAGPIETKEGWVFLQLLDRRYPGGTFPDWDALRDSVTVRSREGVMLSRTEQLLRRLAAREQISIDLEALNGTQVRPMQMFTIRYMGFGGKVPAMPSVMPLYEAVLEGMSRKGTSAP